MRTVIQLLFLILGAVTASPQTISYFNQGFLRQGNAALDRAYIGCGGGVGIFSNYYTTNLIPVVTVTMVVGAGSAAYSNYTAFAPSTVTNYTPTNIPPNALNATNTGTLGQSFVWLNSTQGYWATPATTGITNGQDGVSLNDNYVGTVIFGGALTSLGNSVKTRHATSAGGTDAFAIGDNTVCSGSYSFASGSTSIASGDYAFSTGDSDATANFAHAEGRSTASGSWAHSEGEGTIASASYSHAEGIGSRASGKSSHAQGTNTIASGESSFASGSLAVANSIYTFVWSDGVPFTNSAANQFNVHAANGSRFMHGPVSIESNLSVTNCIFIRTNDAAFPTATAGGGWLWNSNDVLYWVTTANTNFIAGP